MATRGIAQPRRLAPAMYRVLLTSHIVVTGAWLGLAAAKLFFALFALTTAAPGIASALYLAAIVVNVAFPPMAIATIGTGVLLSLGTRWGLVQHTWVLVKLGLTIGVVVSGIRFAERFAQSAALASNTPVSSGSGSVVASASTPLIVLAVVHVLMLGAATVISVYKPWGKSWFGRRAGLSGRQGSRSAAQEAA